jgi:hypothetical protein
MLYKADDAILPAVFTDNRLTAAIGFVETHLE